MSAPQRHLGLGLEQSACTGIVAFAVIGVQQPGWRPAVDGGGHLGGGAFALARIYETEGVYLGESGLSVEEVRDNWSKITDAAGQQAYVNGGEQGLKVMRKLAEG